MFKLGLTIIKLGKNVLEDGFYSKKMKFGSWMKL